MRKSLAVLGVLAVLCLWFVVVIVDRRDITQQRTARKNTTGEKQFAPPALVPGTAMTWTDGTQTWAGSPFCGWSGTLLSANSPSVDRGAMISGFHCPKPGSALNQPRLSNGTYCQEWYGNSPDVGACEYVPPALAQTMPRPQSIGTVK